MEESSYRENKELQNTIAEKIFDKLEKTTNDNKKLDKELKKTIAENEKIFDKLEKMTNENKKLVDKITELHNSIENLRVLSNSIQKEIASKKISFLNAMNEDDNNIANYKCMIAYLNDYCYKSGVENSYIYLSQGYSMVFEIEWNDTPSPKYTISIRRYVAENDYNKHTKKYYTHIPTTYRDLRLNIHDAFLKNWKHISL